jgi:hypothetical protein
LLRLLLAATIPFALRCAIFTEVELLWEAKAHPCDPCKLPDTESRTCEDSKSSP